MGNKIIFVRMGPFFDTKSTKTRYDIASFRFVVVKRRCDFYLSRSSNRMKYSCLVSLSKNILSN